MQKTNFDSPWKNVFQNFLQAFIAFCLPEAAAGKELNTISRRQVLKNRIADALFKVWLKNGEEAWLLVHIEIQAQKETNFPERMYVYNYRIFDRHHKPVISIAVLADDDPFWRPTVYQRSTWYNKLHFEFATIKLLDYASPKESFLKSDNPFGIVILVHLEALKTRKNSKQRLESKLAIIRALYEHGFSKDYTLNLLLFIDWVLALPKPLELKCAQDLEQLQEEKNMQYVTSFERIGMEKGIKQGIEQGMQKGIQQGEAALLIRQLKRRFGPRAKAYEQRVTQADAETLLTWGEKILEVETLEDLFEESDTVIA